MSFVVRVAMRRQFLSLLKELFDAAALRVPIAVVKRGIAASALGWDHRLDAMEGELFADGVGVVAPIGEQRLGLIRDHAEKWSETLHIMRPARHRDATERPAFPAAAGVELGGEAASRSAKRLGRLSPLGTSSTPSPSRP